MAMFDSTSGGQLSWLRKLVPLLTGGHNSHRQRRPVWLPLLVMAGLVAAILTVPAAAHDPGSGSNGHSLGTLGNFETDGDLGLDHVVIGGHAFPLHDEHDLGFDDWDDVINIGGSGPFCPPEASPGTGPWGGGPGILFCDEQGQASETESNTQGGTTADGPDTGTDPDPTGCDGIYTSASGFPLGPKLFEERSLAYTDGQVPK